MAIWGQSPRACRRAMIFKALAAEVALASRHGVRVQVSRLARNKPSVSALG